VETAAFAVEPRSGVLAGDGIADSGGASPSREFSIWEKREFQQRRPDVTTSSPAASIEAI
jgi:hypothetical protein